MTLRNFPPADQCSPEELDAIADLVVSDPHQSYGLAGSREHIEVLCRRYQDIAQDRADLMERDQQHEQARERLGKAVSDALAQRDMARRERDSESERVAALVQTMEAVDQQIDSARMEIRALTATLDAERNERQGEVLAAEADRERADAAERRLEAYQQTLHHNDRIQSALATACGAVTGKTIEQVNLELDEELAAHPDAGPLHHARDQRDHDHQEDTTP